MRLQEDKNTISLGDGLYARITCPERHEGDFLLITSSGKQIYLSREAFDNLRFFADTGMTKIIDHE